MREWLTAAVLALSGCVTQHGPAYEADDELRAAPSAEGVTIVLVGEAGAPTKTASRVAERLDDLLARERASGRATTIVWAGDNILPAKQRNDCPEGPERAWQRPGSSDLAAVVTEHARGGTTAFAVPGLVEWRCGLLDLEQRKEGNPWQMPAAQYTVSLGPSGEVAVTRTCDEDGCTQSGARDDAVVELVMADAVPWIEPSPRGELALAALDHLLEVLAQTRDHAPPRVLVSHLPVEAAGVHGTTGLRANATIHTLYPPLAAAVQDGLFVGVLAGHDRASYVHPDITDAVKRSDKVWVSAPLWQVVSGAASRPIAESLRLAPRMRYFVTSSYVPLSYTPRGGFAVIRIDGNEVRASIHARGRRWETSRISMPFVSPPHPVETVSPPMEPCLRCEDIPAQER